MKKLFFAVLSLFIALLPMKGQTVNFNEESTYQTLYRMLASPFDDNGLGDIDNYDTGSTDFVRLLWNLNELPTDEAMCWWNDPGIPELNWNQWTHQTSLPRCMFWRLYIGIFNANLYLENAPAELKQRRAEVRFLRALFYFHVLDLFGNAPLMTSTNINLFGRYYEYARAAGIDTSIMTEEEFISKCQAYEDNTVVRPEQVGCTTLFNFIVSELKSCETDLPVPGSESYARPSKAAAWLLLARLYLNAFVYTGTSQWELAREYAKKVIDSNAYTLCSNYRYLFMGDNATNGAQHETLFAIDATQRPYSWGCTTYLIASTVNSNYDNGITEHWGTGVHARGDIVNKFQLNADDRALFYTEGRSQVIETFDDSRQGYGFVKFTNVFSDGTSPGTQFADTDFPLMRLAEAYLTIAEADARLNNGTCTPEGISMLNKLRTRAHANELPTVTLNDIADEWAREFMFEGRRRSDLIRMNLFTGGNYLWDWKGGQQSGIAISDHLSRFPLPEEIMVLKSDYQQNPGYMDINKVTLDETFALSTTSDTEHPISLRNVERLDFSWNTPGITGADPSELTIRLQMSPSGNFGQTTNSDEIIPYTGYTYYPFFNGEINTEELNMALLSWKRVKRWSDCPQTIDIYFRCVATIGRRESVSNVVKLTVVPYANNINSTNFYLIGDGIGDGKQLRESAGIGTSMIPMDIDIESYSLESGWYSAGKFTQTVYLKKDKPFWICRMKQGYYMYSSDGTLNGAEYNSYTENIMPDAGQMFTVKESGTYEVTLDFNVQWKKNDNGEWQHPPYLTLKKVDDIEGQVNSVALSGVGSATLKQCPGSFVWYGNVTVQQTGRLHFLVAGVPWGDSGSSFGYAKPGNEEMIVPAGNYVVTFNAATGFYDFYNTNDTRFIWESSPFSLMWLRTLEQTFGNFYYIGWLNNWNIADDSYLLENKDGLIYQITIPSPEVNVEGWFKIASEEAIRTRDWSEYFITAPYDGCEDLEGYLIYDKNMGGAWKLPALTDGDTHYLLQFNMVSKRYKFTPVNPTGISEVSGSKAVLPTIYNLNGIRVKKGTRQLSKGLYIIGGKKIVVR